MRCDGTANLIPSTFSVATSFVAVFLTYKRSPYYAAAYAVNDIVLIVLWSLASATERFTERAILRTYFADSDFAYPPNPSIR